MGVLIEMSIEGDVKKLWDKNNQDEVDDAERSFDELKAKGYIAYKVKKSGKKGSIIRDFDPDAEKIILSPPMAGG